MASCPRVSVVMPVLNPHPKYFPEAVGSILSQTLEEIELIIVEDPSPRSAAEMLAAFSDARIRYYPNPERSSLVQQRNDAIAQARAQFVACMDADDVSEPTRLQTQYDELTRDVSLGVLGSQLTIIDHHGEPRGYRRYPTGNEAILSSLPRFNPIAQPSVMARKAVIVEAGGYQYSKYPANEDYELWCRLAQRGIRFANHREPLVRYRIHPEGLKSSKLRGIIRGTLEVKRMYWEDTMDLRGRVRMLMERVLLLLPPGSVLRLFAWTHFRSRHPRGRAAGSPSVP